MPAIVTIHDKQTGELIDETEVQARPHGTNCQAMIAWRSIVTIRYGDSLDSAIQNTFDEFSRLPPLREYDVKLVN